MKKCSCPITILIVISFLLSVANAQDATDWMPDAALRDRVKAALGLAQGSELTQESMTNLQELKAAHRGITDITGLEHATNMVTCRLSGSSLSDISPLSGITSLQVLRLDNMELTGLDALSGLTQLTELFVRDNGITDVSPLLGLSNLRTLRISGNNLENAHKLSSLNLGFIDITIPDPPPPPTPVEQPQQQQEPQQEQEQQEQQEIVQTIVEDPPVSQPAVSEIPNRVPFVSAWRHSSGQHNSSLYMVSAGVRENGNFVSNHPQVRLTVSGKGFFNDPAYPSTTTIPKPASSSTGVYVIAGETVTIRMNVTINGVSYEASTTATAPSAPPGPLYTLELDATWIVHRDPFSTWHVFLTVRHQNGQAVWGQRVNLSVTNTTANPHELGNSGWLDNTNSGTTSFPHSLHGGNLLYGGRHKGVLWLRNDGIYTVRASVTIDGVQYTNIIRIDEKDRATNVLDVPGIDDNKGVNPHTVVCYSLLGTTNPNANNNNDNKSYIRLEWDEPETIVNSNTIKWYEAQWKLSTDTDWSNVLITGKSHRMFNFVFYSDNEYDVRLRVRMTDDSVSSWAEMDIDADQIDTEQVFCDTANNAPLLVKSVIPESTTLLPNYPNPFNPETWIPYKLSKSTKVIVTIYAMDGNIIRSIDLGHQQAGYYINRNRAAYWDGKNAVGERVASGVYFCELKTDNTSLLQKMFIMK